MGYIAHHALVFIGDAGPITDLRDACMAAMRAKTVTPLDSPLPVTPVMRSPRNGYASFAVLPDGSKEGWDQSDFGDELRSAFIELAGGGIEWALVRFGGDEPGHARLERHSG